MKQLFSITVMAAALLLAGSASAQTRCFEGRTASGECVNAQLAQVMRHSAIVQVQPKITMNAPLNLPSEDSFYPAARDHHDFRALFGAAYRPGTNSIVP